MKVNRSCMLLLIKYYKLYVELSSSVFLNFARCTWVGLWFVMDVAGHIICPILNGQAVQEHTGNS